MGIDKPKKFNVTCIWKKISLYKKKDYLPHTLFILIETLNTVATKVLHWKKRMLWLSDMWHNRIKTFTRLFRTFNRSSNNTENEISISVWGIWERFI